jgi:DNA ligase-1
MIKRRSQVFIWSRGEELVTEKYPELADSTAFLPDGTVLDGEILPWRDGRPLPFSELQRRIGRKTVGKKLLKEVPTAFLAYDVLEFGAEDLRQKPLLQRRKILSQMLSNLPANRIIPSPIVAAQTWQELEILHEESSRHKSGLAVRFPRIARWRRDKKIEEIDTIETLKALLLSP